MVHKAKQKLYFCDLPVQRREMFGVVVEMVEESLKVREEAGKSEPDTGDFLNVLLLPFTPFAFDAEPTILDYSQLLTEFYEN